MKRTNLIRKSVNLVLSVLVAGSIVAVGADGSTMAAVSGNDTIISSVVDAAEVTQIPWSTGYVYQLLPIDLSTGGQGSLPDGTYASVGYAAGANKDWNAHFVTAITADNQTLQFQYMEPKGYLGMCGQGQGFYRFHDMTNTKRFDVSKYVLKTHTHLWEYSKGDFVAEMTDSETNMGTLWYDSVDEGLYYRTTVNYNSMTGNDGTIPATGLATVIEVKATGEVYIFTYKEPTISYNDILAKEIIYSCVPTKLQQQ